MNRRGEKTRIVERKKPTSPPPPRDPLANTVWSDFRLTERHLPELEDFEVVANIDCSEIKPPHLPEVKPWSRFDPNHKLLLVQAAKSFAAAWVIARENLTEPEVLRKIGMSRKQVFILIRSNRDLLGNTNRSRMSEASATMINCVELAITTFRLLDMETKTSFSTVYDKMETRGLELLCDEDAQISKCVSSAYDDKVKVLLGNTLLVAKALYCTEKTPLVSDEIMFHNRTKDAFWSLMQEFGEKCDIKEWDDYTILDISMMARGSLSANCFRYILHTVAERLCFLVQESFNSRAIAKSLCRKQVHDIN